MEPPPPTQRLTFCRYRSTDLDELMEIFGDEEVMRFYPGTRSRDQTAKWLDWMAQHYEQHGYGLWRLDTNGSENSFAGHCGLIYQNGVNGRDEVEIGYALVRRLWSQGLATEAARATRNFAFGPLKLTRVVSLIAPGNLRSVQVALNNGMCLESQINRWDKLVDVYSLNRDD